ncbi:TPA: hypothetical protein QCU53_005810, partial [Bacillus thuringiensis]|nr:hypothetical protein [Bacillus thuringiensis]
MKEKNEYGVMELNSFPYSSKINNNYSKYPLETEPNQLLQPTSDKDFLNLCHLNYRNSGDPKDFADTGAAVSSGIIVTGTMIAAFGALTVISAPIGVLGAIVISFGTLLPLIWSVEKPKIFWTQFFALGETLTGQTLLDNVREEAHATLSGFGKILNNYSNAFDYWLRLKKQQIPGSRPTPELQEAAQTVKTRFEIVHNSFDENLSDLQLYTYKVVLLSSYAQAANLHLNLLQQGVQFADQWNKDIYPSQISPSAGTSVNYYKDLKKHIEDYSNYCIETYNSGLSTLKNSPDITWNIFNRYRRDMTLTVLDLVATFQNYDPSIYSIDTKTELTRTIYSNLFGIIQPGVKYTAALENALTLKPDLYKILRGLTFNTTFGSNANYLSGISNIYNHINSSTNVNGPFFGNHNGSQNILNMPRGQNIIRVSFLRNKHLIGIPAGPTLFEPDQIVDLKLFYGYRESEKHRYIPGNQGLIYENTNLSFSDNSEHLSSILMIPPRTIGSNLTHIYTFAWTNQSTNQQNSILRDAITQIPAVKANNLGVQSRIIEGPGHTGGNLIVLKDNIRFTCQYSNPPQSFYIRIRYASNGILNNRSTLSVTIPGVAGESVSLSETFSGVNYKNLKVGCFKF